MTRKHQRQGPRRLAEAVAEWRRRAREGEELAALDGRELRDLGLNAYEVSALRASPVQPVARPDIDALLARAHEARAEAIRAAFRDLAAWFRRLMPDRRAGRQEHGLAAVGLRSCAPAPSPDWMPVEHRRERPCRWQ